MCQWVLPVSLLWALASAFSEVVLAAPQVPLQITNFQPDPSERGLRGRFLHITDMHPDPYYKPHASQSSSCHRDKPRKEKERSGYYGTAYSDCDSPFRLTNLTLDFLDKHWSNEIDFVIWTGDNARHDNDRELPRTTTEINALNRVISTRMEKIFLRKGIPVIPSLGNNDVWPHNILTPGPNAITNEFSSIWKSFIPFPSYQVFQRGAYYSVEVVPNKLAVVSLNTMYFFDSNKAVGGCEYTDPTDAGNLEFDWLDVQLKVFRERGMKVWLSGHVPPSPGNYFPECFVRYTELALRYQDTILGHLFGHMNADHFFFLESDDLELWPSRMRANSNKELYDDLLADFGQIRKIKKLDLDEYAVINVSPSVVPNPYLPSFRIFSYNVTGFKSGHEGVLRKKEKKEKEIGRKHGHHHGGDHKDKAAECKKAPSKYTWKCQLKEPWHSDPEAPSRVNTLWSPLGYAQYYLPDLDSANKSHRPKFKLEYLTFPLSHLHPSPNNVPGFPFEYPLPLKNLPRSLRDHNVTMKKGKKYAPYGMKDLTVPQWVKLGRRLANPKKTGLRKRWRKYMFVGGDGDE